MDYNMITGSRAVVNMERSLRCVRLLLPTLMMTLVAVRARYYDWNETKVKNMNAIYPSNEVGVNYLCMRASRCEVYCVLLEAVLGYCRGDGRCVCQQPDEPPPTPPPTSTVDPMDLVLNMKT